MSIKGWFTFWKYWIVAYPESIGRVWYYIEQPGRKEKRHA